MEGRTSKEASVIKPELYFLILKFLASGPLKETTEIFGRELEKCKILPKRLDWEGNEHERSFEDLELQYPHVGPDHLLQICGRIGPILDKEIPPSVRGVLSLLGAGSQSLLRNGQFVGTSAQLMKYAARRNCSPLLDPAAKTVTHNIVNVLGGRELSGPIVRRLAITSHRYSQQQLLRCTLGHLSAVYCLLFDHTGKYILTGADDLLIKLWSTIDGRLLSTFRGASAEITDIDINLENSMLAAGSLDRVLRVWDLQTGSPIAVLTSHTGMITSVNFCPSNRWDVRYLITTSTDGSVAFWTYSYGTSKKPSFVSKPIQYHERMRPGQAQMICSSFSPGGTFLAAGSADHHVRVYHMHGDEGPRRILEIEAHTDTVDSIQWAHQGLRFISGSKDGTANLWHFECQQWKSHQLLMSTKLPGAPATDEDPKKLKVTMVSWSCSDNYVITAVNDHNLKVWFASTGKLTNVLSGHTDEIYVLESHPKDSAIVLSAGHDGQIFIWDVEKGISIAQFTNTIEGQGHGAVFDAKWSPDGNMFAATDSHGHILTYSYGTPTARMQILPKELFFHTDYRPLVRDSNHWVLDEQTQVAPHLMPPPFLVDVDGNPYPPMLQRLVPGREHCQAEQLVPNIIVGAGGMQEVIEGLPDEQPRSDIDRMIAALAQRQYGAEGNGNDGNVGQEQMDEVPQRPQGSPRSNMYRLGMRRNGDVEGVRQSTGNWHKDPNAKWNKHLLVQPLNRYALEKAQDVVEYVGETEMEEYRREMRRRPVMINTAAVAAPVNRNRTLRTNRRRNAPVYRTRAVRTEQREEEDRQPDENEEVTPSNSSNSSGESSAHEDLLLSGSSSDSSESSGYSDWVAADHGVNLEPPKRSKRRPVKKRPPTPPSDSEKKKTKPKKNIHASKLVGGEVPEIFRPPEWLSEVIPRKAPYYPQMGDEIVYFRQGHQLYIDAIENKKVYEFSAKNVPWIKTELREQELVKVVGIKYEIKPPRLCCLKLALMDTNGYLTGDNFTIKYHDMADVLDFLVLKQTFDTAEMRNWSIGDRFRCMIDDGWWMGEIVSQSPVNEEFPDSLFMCYQVRWDNGEFERMSPWDLEPINEERLPSNVGEAVPVLPEEIQSILYQPQSDEWPRGDREATCRRIIAGLDQVMGLAIAEPFMAPVDLNMYPTYAFIVEYPIDLSTVKARFENHFYRRITSAQFDVRYLATNAEKFNEAHSVIVRHARIVSELCLRIIKGGYDEIDVAAVYHQLVDTYESSDSEVDVETVQPGPSTSRAGRLLRSTQRPSDWRQEAKTLLEAMWQCKDSTPFREPVDRMEHPDYYQVIDTPMDLGTVREDLLGGNYETPLDFSKDVKLIFTNSRAYNTNKRSRIYSMTIRLSAMFEEHMRKIIYNWKSARRRMNSNSSKKRRQSNKMVTRNNGARPQTVRKQEVVDTDDDDDSDVPLRPSTSKRFVVANNGHPSTSQGGASGSVKVKKEDKASSDSSSDGRSRSSDAESDVVVHVETLGARSIRKKANYDSEDSYKPSAKKKNNSRKSARNLKRKKKFLAAAYESDDDEDDDRNDINNSDSEPLVNLKTKNALNHEIDNDSTDEDSDDQPLISHKTEPTVANGEQLKSFGKCSSQDESSQSSSRLTRSSVKKYQEKSDNSESDEDVPLQALRAKRRLASDSEYSEEEQRHRTRRVQAKRPHYNEDSDESTSGNNGRRVNSFRNNTNNQPDSDNSSRAEPVVISSRGRVCRLTPRARAAFLRE